MARGKTIKIPGYQREYLMSIHPDLLTAIDMLIERDKMYASLSLSEIRRIVREELQNNGSDEYG